MTARAACIVLAPLAFYLAALNPYLMPGFSDNLAYYYSARSLVEQGSYEFDGVPITNWPPGFPLMLALPFFAGLKSILAAKLVVLVLAGLGMIFTYVLLRRENYRYPAIASFLAWMLPQVMQAGASIMSEVPFLTISLVFLYLLHLQRTSQRGLPFAVFAGVILGWAALTRWFGALLGVALIVQALMQLRSRTVQPLWKRCLPEFVNAAVGGIIVIAWCQLFLGGWWNIPFLGIVERKPLPGAGIPPGQVEEWMTPWLEWEAAPEDLETALLKRVAPAGLEDFYAQPRALRALDCMSDLLFQQQALLRFAGLPADHPLRYLFMIPLVFVVAGLVHRCVSGKGSPPDGYALASALALGAVGWHETRYWVPLAPFFMAWFLEGGSLIWTVATRRVSIPGKSMVPALVLAGYLLFLLAYAGDRLFRPNSPHGGLCYLASPRPQDFYLGFWGDLYRCSQAIRNEAPEGNIVFAGQSEPWQGFAGPHDYVEHFTGRNVVNYPPRVPPSYLLVLAPLEVPAPLGEALGLQLLEDTPRLKAYRVAPPSAGRGDGK